MLIAQRQRSHGVVRMMFKHADFKDAGSLHEERLSVYQYSQSF
jgi:hypothetical protein